MQERLATLTSGFPVLVAAFPPKSLSSDDSSMKSRKWQWRTALVVVLICTPAAHASETVIDTLSDLSNVYNVNSFGEGTTPTYGQTVTVPTDNILDSFTFRLGHGGDVPTTVRFIVMAWDVDRVSGPVLFESDPTTLIESQFYQNYTIMTGGLPLVAGNQYALFFTSFLDYDGINDQSSALARHYSTDPYPDGRFVLNNNASSLAGLAANAWQIDFLGTGDLAFLAEFSSPLTGDYNHNGVVDAADYVAWRKTDGGQTGYDDWRSNFGNSQSGNGTVLNTSVPEPSSWLAIAFGACALLSPRRPVMLPRTKCAF